MPPAVVTVTGTLPVVRAGATNVTVVAVTELGVTTVVPTFTVLPLRFEPVSVIRVPPARLVLDGEIAVRTGAAWLSVKSSAVPLPSLVPPGPLTVTSTRPPSRAGAEAISRVTPLVTLRVNVALVPPKRTAVARARPAPVIVTDVPAAPLLVDRLVTCGVTATGDDGVVMPLIVYAPLTTVSMNDHDTCASPSLPQPVPHWLRSHTPALS